MSGTIEYRCRRCGRLDRAVHTPELLTSVVELVNHGRVRSTEGVPCHDKHIHTCPDGGLGISDCVGGVADDEARKCPPLLADGWVVVSWKRDQTDTAWILCAVHEDIDNGTIGWWYRFDSDGRWDLMSSTTGTGFSPDRTPPLREVP